MFAKLAMLLFGMFKPLKQTKVEEGEVIDLLPTMAVPFLMDILDASRAETRIK